METDRPLSIVTGASAGLGRGLAQALCARGHLVAGVARRRERLEAMAQELVGFEPWPVDLREAPARAALVEGYLARCGAPDYLILNAGLAHYGRLDLLSAEQIEEQIEVNLVAVVDLVQRFLPALLARGRGRILVIASLLGLGPLPYTAVYAATKAAAIGLVRGLRVDLRGSGVRASAVCPGGVRTEFAALASGEAQARRAHQEPLERVVAGVLRQLDADRAVLFPTPRAALAALALRLVPGVVERLVATRLRVRLERELPPARTGRRS